MRPKIIAISVLIILMIISDISTATPPGFTGVYGVKIHLANKKILNGYIEVPLYLKGCDGKSDNYFGESDNYETGENYPTFKEYVAKNDSNAVFSNEETIRFIDKLIEIKYEYKNKKLSELVAAKSSVKQIKIADVKSIEGVCRKWDGRKTNQGIPIITDYMAKYMSNQKMVAFYIYSEAALAEAGKIPEGEDCGLCSCSTLYLSYNPEYTQQKLIKLRKQINKMTTNKLDKEKLIRSTSCFD